MYGGGLGAWGTGGLDGLTRSMHAVISEAERQPGVAGYMRRDMCLESRLHSRGVGMCGIVHVYLYSTCRKPIVTYMVDRQPPTSKSKGGAPDLTLAEEV